MKQPVMENCCTLQFQGKDTGAQEGKGQFQVPQLVYDRSVRHDHRFFLLQPKASL